MPGTLKAGLPREAAFDCAAGTIKASESHYGGLVFETLHLEGEGLPWVQDERLLFGRFGFTSKFRV